MSARLFSIKDDSILKELYSSKTNKELVQVFDGRFSMQQIKHRGKCLGLYKDKKTLAHAQKTRTGVWEEWETEIILRHYNKKGVEYVSNLLPHRSRNSIIHKASRCGIAVDKDIRNYANGPKHHTEDAKKLMSEKRRCVVFTEEHKNNLMLSARKGKEHPHYNPNRVRKYGFGFTDALKRRILRRDSNTCVLCNKKRKLLVHHIDYDKTHSTPENLVALCYSCHVKHHYHIPEEQKKQEQDLFVRIARLRTEVT